MLTLWNSIVVIVTSLLATIFTAYIASRVTLTAIHSGTIVVAGKKYAFTAHPVLGSIAIGFWLLMAVLIICASIAVLRS
jgi:hypothetical protein